MALNSGWLHVDRGGGNAMQIPFEDSKYSPDFLGNTILNLPGDNTFGFGFGTVKRMVQFENLRFESQADVELALFNFEALHQAGVPFKLEWQIRTAGAAGDFFAFDGTTRSMQVMFPKGALKGLGKSSPGDQQKYIIPSILFQEAEK